MDKSLQEIFNLTGKVAIVTGGAKGIGKGTALRLAEAGASIMIADIDEKGAEQAMGEIKKLGSTALFVKTDMSKLEDIQNLVSATVKKFKKIDILVNNAGIFPFAPFLDLTEELWDKVLDVNLKGSVFCSQAVAKEMIRQKIPGKIINISSIDSLHPSGNLVHYDASKGGLSMATKSMALELAPHKIRVNAIAPGAIATSGTVPSGANPDELFKDFLKRVPLSRMGEPDDIAMLTLFLASEAASYITGSVFVVDGGYLLS